MRKNLYNIYFILIVSIIPGSCKLTQNNIDNHIEIKGTLIIGAVGNNGIVIAVDSRAAIIGPNNQIMGYIDSIPKMALLNEQYPIAIAGKSTVGEKFVYNIISEFNKKENKNSDVQQSFIDFREMLVKTETKFQQQFIGGGYYQGAAYLFSFNNSDKSADATGFVFSEPDLTPYLQKYADTSRSCEELNEILERVIYTYAKDKNKEFEIGGPISIINVLPGNKITWVQNNFLNKRVLDYTTMVNLIKEGKISLTPVSGNTRLSVIKGMESNPKYKNYPKLK